jgi:hypothetical protein
LIDEDDDDRFGAILKFWMLVKKIENNNNMWDDGRSLTTEGQ